eukprot:TRINITY_DN57975_c0_g1_i1.p2 TRINITY_DN57975_c0_g1~~TRINITY_DN57975_c0_g1_i1.p2  ORF type:complete len:220 (-),score=26.24 TRINITY_DN57975_c0_g1_i1:126-764(-)
MATVDVLVWSPVLAFVVFIATIAAVIATSLRLTGGSPCEKLICDISVYGGWPPGEEEQYIFRGGFTLLVFLLILAVRRRFADTAALGALCFFGIAMVTLLLMAWIPFWASRWHFICAALTFVFLPIGQCMDASADKNASESLTRLRHVIIGSTVLLFFTWAISPLLTSSGMPLSILEYPAATLPFVYFMTWSWQEYHSDADGSSSENLVSCE